LQLIAFDAGNGGEIVDGALTNNMVALLIKKDQEQFL
jgi:hypothetical protein